MATYEIRRYGRWINQIESGRIYPKTDPLFEVKVWLVNNVPFDKEDEFTPDMSFKAIYLEAKKKGYKITKL